MNWRFTIIDRANVSHEISEPVGFDSIEIDIKRDENTHGIIFDYQGKDMKYYGDAMQLLKDEYDTYGSQGDMILVIEQSCDDVLTELYRGKFLFLQYDESIGDECFVKIPIENTGDVIDLTTKWDQKVDLSTTVAFDGATALDGYSKLGFDLSLPSKGIILQDKSELVLPSETLTIFRDIPYIAYDSSSSNYNYGWFNAVPQFEKTDFSEIGIFATATKPEYNFICSGFYNSSPSYYASRFPGLETIVIQGATVDDYRTMFFQWDNTTALLVNDNGGNNFNAVPKFDLSISFTMQIDTLAHAAMLAIYIVICIRKKDGTYIYIDKVRVISASFTGGEWPANTSHIFSHNQTYSNIEMSDGDYLFAYVAGLCRYNNVYARDNQDEVIFKIKSTEGSVLIKSISHTASSTTKAFLVNEVISRISEAITNNKIKAYSEYFGRTDSQPYSVSANGIGSMEALAKGIYIRNQQNRIVGQPNVFSLSMKDVFEGIEPIHHIGFGIEDDPARSGYKRLRVEHWKHFYTDDLIMSCIGVRNIQRKIVDSKHYSTFQFGYEKYEAEQYNGLDEFLTKRTFRTTLNGLKNELNKVSKFIASGYAWEITRRKNTDSSDWRFDNDTFIVCLRDSIILKQGTTVVVVDGGTGSVIQLNDASFVGITPLAIGDKISITNSTNNTGIYTITYIGYDGTVDHIDGWLVRVTVAEVLVSEYIELGNYVIERTGGYFVETGNVDSPSNLVDPDTTYNFRISPIRNAMRWMDKIAQGYKSNPTIIFTDGIGNYFASGKMTDSFGRLENAVIAENETIVTATFADATKVDPLLAPEQLTFDFPMSIAEFRNIMANPYGKIYWKNEFENGYGYINNIKYKPEEGIASFLLIPKL